MSNFWVCNVMALTDAEAVDVETMSNFWDSGVWGWMLLMGILLGSLLVGNVIKKSIPILQQSLIPTSVLGGAILLIVAAVYKLITGDVLFDTALFNGKGTDTLEIITYHSLALGFIASSFKTTGGKLTKQRGDHFRHQLVVKGHGACFTDHTIGVVKREIQRNIGGERCAGGVVFAADSP